MDSQIFLADISRVAVHWTSTNVPHISVLNKSVFFRIYRQTDLPMVALMMVTARVHVILSGSFNNNNNDKLY